MRICAIPSASLRLTRWLPSGGDSSQTGSQASSSAALTAIKAVHTAAWFSIESCMLYVLYAGFRGRSDRRTAIAAAVVTGEILIFAANGFRCPLSDVAEQMGAEKGSVTDIYLPAWFARNLPAIHAPLLAAAAYLHRKSISACLRRMHRRVAR